MTNRDDWMFSQNSSFKLSSLINPLGSSYGSHYTAQIEKYFDLCGVVRAYICRGITEPSTKLYKLAVNSHEKYEAWLWSTVYPWSDVDCVTSMCLVLRSLAFSLQRTLIRSWLQLFVKTFTKGQVHSHFPGFELTSDLITVSGKNWWILCETAEYDCRKFYTLFLNKRKTLIRLCSQNTFRYTQRRNFYHAILQATMLINENINTFVKKRTKTNHFILKLPSRIHTV